MWLPWIYVVLLLGLGGWLLTKVIPALRNGSILDHDEERNEHVVRKDQPIRFWMLIILLGGVSVTLIIFAVATAGGALGFWEPLV